MRKKLLFCLSLWAVCAFTTTVMADEVKTDYTDAIVNADLSTTDAWDASQTKGIKDGMVKVGGNVFDFTQTITLPAGQYKMTVKAAYRYANSTKPEEEYEYNQIQAGVETHLAKLYAETSSYKYEANVMNRWEGASDTDYAAGSGSVTVNGKFVPNSSAAVQAWFNAGQYVNELVFNVQEEGAVKIGIAKTENCPDGDYTNIGAWTLTRLGDAEADPKEEEPTPEEPETPVYTMVQNEADLVAGGKYLIMAEVNGGWVALSDLSGKIRVPSDTLTVSENFTVATTVATAISEAPAIFAGAAYELTLEGEPGAWKFKDELNGAYLHWSSGNYLINDAEGSAWAIAFNQYAHNAVITHAVTTERVLQYNASAPRFCAYTSVQAPVYLFKAGEVTVAPVAPSNPSFNTIAELLAFEVGNMIDLNVNNAKITYLSGNNMSITDGTDTLAIYDYNIPADYVVGGFLSGKITATLGEYKGNKQLTVVDWSEVTFSEPPYFADGDYLIINTETGYYLGGGNDWGTHATLLGKPQFFTFAHQGNNAYTLDSHQSNGGDSHYLATGLYCDGAAANWTFAKNENGNYTINNGGNYLAGNGTNKVIVTVTEVTAAAEWTIISRAEAFAALDAATVEAPADATIYINNPECKRNAGGWTVTSADGTGAPSNYALGGGGNTANCAESYHSTNGFDLSQVLVGMKPGVYRLDGHAFYRNDGDNTGAFPYFYVNDQQSRFPELTGSENSMAAAYASFLNGSYAIAPIYFTVAEGDEVKIGVHGDNTAFWNIWGELGLTYYGADASIAEVKASSVYAEYKAAIGKPMNAEVLATMEAAKAAYEAETSDDNLTAFTSAVAAAVASANAYATSKPAIDAMFALMESTNVYTAEAYAAYSAKAEDFLAQYEARTLTVAVDNPAAIHGWHANVDYDDLLLSAFGVKDFDTNLYINTWSTEGETDGSEFKVPFFEYWTGDDQSLGATTKTATVTGLEPGELYSLEAWVRTRAKNGVAAAEATGITLNVGAGAAVDVTEGAVIGTSQFAHAVYKATGVADENGNLTINFNVAAENNVSWLSFKDLKYSVAPASDEFLYVYAQLEVLTETCYTMQMMPAVSGKYYEVQETSWNMKDTIDKVTSEQFEAQIAVMQETIAYVQTMDAKYNEWKNMLFTCYDYQDNSTPDSAAVATAFAEVVDVHAGYQWSMPATSTTEIDVLIDELDEARVIYASNATANEGFEFDLVEVESPWIGAVLVDSIKTYIYNTKAEAFLGAGNSWGTQASFTATGLEWIVSGESKLYTFDGPMLNGAKHYFDGAYTDAAAKEIRVRQVGDNVFTFIVDGKYLAYDGTSIVANVTELNDACYWQFVTKAERQSKYVIATAETPVDATFEISGANFGRNDGNNSAWVGSPALGGDNANFCAEKWNAGLATVSQELTNMPAGVYRMDVQGFYRMGDVKSATDARVAGTEILHAKFFANGDSINVMSVIDECGKMNEGSQYGSYGLAPNSMAQASHAFSAGLYEHSMYVVLPEGESTINLGVTKTGSVANDWLIFDNFRLTYFGNISMEDVNLAERKAEFVAKYDAFEALYPELGLLMGIQNTYFLPVQEPAYMIKDTIDNVTDIALLDSMITEISNATDSLTVALDIYNGAYAEVFALAGDIFDNSTPINDEVETAMSDALTFNGMMGAYMAQTIQNLEMMVTNLTTAIYDYVPNAVANEGYEFDLTYFVADADETSAGWVNEVSGFNGNFVYKISTEKNTEELKSDGFIEAWQQAAYTGALSYTKDMPNGYYTLSAYTFTSGSTKFFANTDSVVVENTGKFTMSVIDSVLVTDGVLKFGLHVENTNWVGLANIKLVHLGADSSAIELPTLTPIAVEPTTGYEVAMSRINVVFDNLVVPNYEFADSIRVYDAEGNVVAKAGIEDCEPDWETIVYVQLDKAVDVSGTYTISIPAGMFIVEDEYESEAYEATVTLNIVPDGISNIEAGKQTVIVYTITGKAIQTTVDGMKTLEKGIYIVNGKKVYVK